MNRELWRGLAVALALVGALAALFFTLFERATETVDFNYSPAARLNDYLAATRFLNRMGIPAESMPSLTPGSTLPPPTDVLLLPTQRLTVDRATQAALLDWVAGGGHLVIAARGDRVVDGLGDLFEKFNSIEQHGDPLFDALGLRRVELDLDPDEIDRYRPFAVDFPAAERFVWVEADPNQRVAADERRWPALAGDHNGALLRSGTLGDGRVSVLADRRPLHNRNIGDQDHALYLWHLVNLHAPPGKVWLVFEDDMPALPVWLWDHAHELVASALLLALLALARAMPRFGPLQGTAAPRRRSLIEHLRASGRLQWRYGDHGAMLRAIQAELLRTVTLKHPAAAKLDPTAAATHLAALLDLPEADLRQALTAVPGDRFKLDREAFTRAVRLLTELRKRL